MLSEHRQLFQYRRLAYGSFKWVIVLKLLRRWRCDAYELRTAFSALMRSCNGLKSLFPPSAGIVELWASLVAALLNIVSYASVGGTSGGGTSGGDVTRCSGGYLCRDRPRIYCFVTHVHSLE